MDLRGTAAKKADVKVEQACLIDIASTFLINCVA